MKIICKKEILSRVLNVSIKAIASRSTLNILEYFFIRVKDNNFTITSNDLEIGIEISNIEAEIIEEGSVAIDAKIFYEIINKFNDDLIYISSDKDYIVTITSQKSEFKLIGLSGDDFPFLPNIKKENRYFISSYNFKNMIKETIFSVGFDQSKPSMTGILFEFKNKFINMVTVDGFRVSHSKTEFNSDIEEFSVIIPPKTLNQISKIINEDIEINFYITDNHILFEFDNIVIVSRLIEGEFLSYEEVFSLDFITTLKVNVNEIILSIEKASLISYRENKKIPIKFTIDRNNLIITSTTELGNYRDEIFIDVDGEPVEIAFNPKFLLDAIKSINEEFIDIGLTTSISPCVIRPMENNYLRYLILPLRIRN